MSRLWIDQRLPRIARAHNSWAAAVTTAAEEAGVDRRLVELINLRVSQINGCPACLNAHYTKALEVGETVQRIGVLPAWRHADLYSDQEKAALGLAESITLLPRVAEQDAAYARAAEVFSEDQLAVIEWVAVTINSFNRVSITSRHPVRPERSGA